MGSGHKEWSDKLLYGNEKHCLRQQRRKIYEPYLNLTDIYESYVDCKKNYTKYLDSIENTVKELGVFSSLEKLEILQNIKDIRFAVEDVLIFLNVSICHKIILFVET